MPKQQNITIRIADAPPISMNIAADTEKIIRHAEYNVNKVWNAWRKDFSDRTSKEVLAMVTFQFAKSYYQLLEQVERQKNIFENFENELDRLLEIATDREEKPESTANA